MLTLLYDGEVVGDVVILRDSRVEDGVGIAVRRRSRRRCRHCFATAGSKAMLTLLRGSEVEGDVSVACRLDVVGDFHEK